MNPLLRLSSFGQSVWVDFIRRSMITSGELARLIREDGIRGVTSNPTIFGKAIVESDEYDGEIATLVRTGKSPAEIYERLTVEDIRQAADVLRPVYDQMEGTDGFVSLEVSPHLAHDTAGTIAEAGRLWAAVERPNLFIKVPATREGLPAITELIAAGINVNITLLFGLERYHDVADAYVTGLEQRVRRNRSVERVASVASFFLSRIDTLIDPQLEKAASEPGPCARLATSLLGQTAIASAKAAYQIYREIFDSARFRGLAARGAHTQRLLWASTSTKNPAYSDVKYVEPLIGPETINTMPVETIAAYRDHGDPAPRLVEGISEAPMMLARLSELGIDLAAATQQLEDDGIRKFIAPYDSALERLKSRSDASTPPPSGLEGRP